MFSILLYSIALPVLILYATQYALGCISVAHRSTGLYLGWLVCYWGTQGWPSLPLEAKESVLVIFALLSLIVVLFAARLPTKISM